MIIGIKKINKNINTDNLNQNEVERINGYQSRKRRYESFTSLLMLTEILEEKNINNFEIGRFNSGKPYIKESNLYFNLSHSNDYAACVVSKFQVGIDIEKIRSRIRRIAPRFLHEKELIKFNDNKLSNKELTIQWTIKEAFTKFLGAGLTIPFNKIEIKKIKDYYIANYKEIDGFIKTFFSNDYVVSVCSNNLDSISNRLVEY